MEKTLDTKLRRIQEDSGVSDFILADAKDADMGFGIAAPGGSPKVIFLRATPRFILRHPTWRCFRTRPGRTSRPNSRRR
ncbi:MAG: hypothetical protein IH991_17685 [Planctomycetes bacterium]|nr:hypothetical protein [Planctomycetota bacterium]